MILSGILGTIFWIRSRRWFKSYKYPYQLLVRILIQLCIVGLISLLSTTLVSPPRSYGDFSIFLPLSYPFVLAWEIDGLLPVWPPYQYFTISVFGFYIEGGLLNSEFGSLVDFRIELFLHSIPLFLLMNVVFTTTLIVLSELWKSRKIRIESG